MWDTTTGQCLRTLVHEDNASVTAVRFSPNGKYILANTLDSCVRLWDYAGGTCKKTYQGHTNVKYSIGSTFGDGPPGSEGFVVAGSESGELVFWDANNKDVVQRAKGHNGVVIWVDTSPKVPGQLVTCGLDGKVLIWVDGEDEGAEELVDETNGMKLEPSDEMAGTVGNGVPEHFDQAVEMINTPRAETVNGIDSPAHPPVVEGSSPNGDRMEE